MQGSDSDDVGSARVTRDILILVNDNDFFHLIQNFGK